MGKIKVTVVEASYGDKYTSTSLSNRFLYDIWDLTNNISMHLDDYLRLFSVVTAIKIGLWHMATFRLYFFSITLFFV